MRLIDIACGAGMASAGVLDGFTALTGRHGIVEAAVDPWAPAAASYAVNIPELRPGGFLQQRAEDVVGQIARLRADLVITGPPCQGDSTLNRCRVGAGVAEKHRRPDRRTDLAAVKEAAVIGGTSAPLVVMEIVGKHWDDWAVARGAKVVRLQDAALGGYTMRRRTFAFFGPWKVPTLAQYRKAFPWAAAPRGWDVGILRATGRGADVVRGIFASGGAVVLANDASKEEKRKRQWCAAGTPGYAIAGHGTSHRIYQLHPWRYAHRVTPDEAAVSSGFDGIEARRLRLVVPAGTPSGAVRNQQTLVGNGWPASFGRFVALAFVRSQR